MTRVTPSALGAGWTVLQVGIANLKPNDIRTVALIERPARARARRWQRNGATEEEADVSFDIIIGAAGFRGVGLGRICL